jgi:hypothetical protein
MGNVVRARARGGNEARTGSPGGAPASSLGQRPLPGLRRRLGRHQVVSAAGNLPFPVLCRRGPKSPVQSRDRQSGPRGVGSGSQLRLLW